MSAWHAARRGPHWCPGARSFFTTNVRRLRRGPVRPSSSRYRARLPADRRLRTPEDHSLEDVDRDREIPHIGVFRRIWRRAPPPPAPHASATAATPPLRRRRPHRRLDHHARPRPPLAQARWTVLIVFPAASRTSSYGSRPLRCILHLDSGYHRCIRSRGLSMNVVEMRIRGSADASARGHHHPEGAS